MLANYINNLQLIAFTIMLFMGHYLMNGSIPMKKELLQYRKSRKLIGISFLILSLQFFLQWFFKAREEFFYIASALNITFFSFSGTFLAYSDISMLDNNFISKNRIIKDAADRKRCRLKLQLILTPLYKSYTILHLNNTE